MMLRQHAAAKNLANFEKEREEMFEFEQKPVKNFDAFSDI